MLTVGEILHQGLVHDLLQGMSSECKHNAGRRHDELIIPRAG